MIFKSINQEIHIYNIIRKNGNKIVETFETSVKCELLFFFIFTRVTADTEIDTSVTGTHFDFRTCNKRIRLINILAFISACKKTKQSIETWLNGYLKHVFIS
jgi:hypothetical protein